MKTKRLLCPQRLRTVPHQFSWIGRRLLREGHIARPGKTHLATALGYAACQHGYSATAFQVISQRYERGSIVFRRPRSTSSSHRDDHN